MPENKKPLNVKEAEKVLEIPLKKDDEKELTFREAKEKELLESFKEDDYDEVIDIGE